MADKEISDLTLVNTMNATDWLHVKQGSADVRVIPSTLFALHIAESNPHSITKTTVALGNVTNDAQLKIASNLADLNNVATARTNLDVMSSAEVAAAIAAHASRTDDPHNVTKDQVDLGNVQNYTISNNPDVNSTTQYASIAAVNVVRQQANSLANNLVPAGGIIMWATTNPIPSGWAACDGLNGTVDLRGMFVRGGELTAGPNQVGTIGGSDTVSHTHSGQASPHALTVGQLPNFSLSTRCTPNIRFDEYGGGYQALSPGDYAENIQHRTSSIGNGETHSHGLSVDSTITDNRPRYYTIIFIQKLP